jgi:predicted GTPase
VVIHQVDTAAADKVEFVRGNIRKRNPKATILETACRVLNTAPESIKGRRVQVVEDGPTLTHEILTAFTASRKRLPSKVTKK